MKSKTKSDSFDTDSQLGTSSSGTFTFDSEAVALTRSKLVHGLCRPQSPLHLPGNASDGDWNALEDSFSFLPWKVRFNDKSKNEKEIPSYLDLRRRQNVEFADEKCREANILGRRGDAKKAKELFVQALDLVPSHLNSLIGYGKLLLESGRLAKAEDVLKSALKVDEENVEVKGYLVSLQLGRNQSMIGIQSIPPAVSGGQTGMGSRNLILKSATGKSKHLTARESTAYMDALMERNLQMDQPPEVNSNCDQEDLSQDESDSIRNRRKRSKKKHSRSRRRRRSKDGRKRKKKKKRRKKSYRSDSSDELSSDPSLYSDSASSRESSAESFSLDASKRPRTFQSSESVQQASDQVYNHIDVDDEQTSRQKEKRRNHRYERESKRNRKRKREYRSSKKKRRQRRKDDDSLEGTDCRSL